MKGNFDNVGETSPKACCLEWMIWSLICCFCSLTAQGDSSRFNSRMARKNTAQRKLKELGVLGDRIQIMKRLLKEIELCRRGTLRQVAERLANSGSWDRPLSHTPKHAAEIGQPRQKHERKSLGIRDRFADEGES